jgi:hypothetical protein
MIQASTALNAKPVSSDGVIKTKRSVSVSCPSIVDTDASDMRADLSPAYTASGRPESCK